MQLAELVGDRLKEAKRNAENAELQARLDAVTAERDRFRRKYNNAHRAMRRYGRRISQLETTLKGTAMNDTTNTVEAEKPTATIDMTERQRTVAKNIITGMIGHADNLKTALDKADAEYTMLREVIAAECASLAVQHGIDVTELLGKEKEADHE